MGLMVEVCIDNMESLPIAIKAGAGRIELCNALALGGLTPSVGFMEQAIRLASVPVYPIIRHRPGDFVFDTDEITIMVADIRQAKSLGAEGVVVGALTEDGAVDERALDQFMTAADGIDVTFHRAFDLCQDPTKALETLVGFGCGRILTSGQQPSAERGTSLIKQLIQQADGRISLMPGCGVNAENALKIINETGASEIHLSGKTTRPGKMNAPSDVTIDIAMGSSESGEGQVDITGYEQVRAVVDLLEGF